MRAFELFGEIFLRDNGASRSLGEIEGSARRADGALGNGIKTAAKWGGAMVLAAGTAAAAIGGIALNAAVSYEKQMANVATLLDGDVKAKIKGMGDEVKKMSVKTGTSTKLLTDGLYQVVSAFGETDDAMKILEISAKGADAGNATVTDSVNLLSAVTKGYGDTSVEATQKASDLAFETVRLGQTTFPELASSMGKVIPLAGAMNVKQEELFGSMATLTGVTGDTAEVSTQLRGVIQGFMKPTDSMSKALETMGFKTGDAAIESLGLDGALKGLKKAAGGSDTELVNMFGSVEAGTAVLALTGSQSDEFTEKTKAMAKAAGATNEAFKIQQATTDAMMKKMKASFDVIMITLGEKLLPIFNDFLEWVIEHMPEIQKFIDGAMQVVGDVFTSVGNIIKDVLIPAFKKFWEWIKPYMPQIKEAVKIAFDIIKGVFKLVGDYITNIVIPIYKAMAEWFFKNFPAIKDAVMKAYDYIKPSFDHLVQVIRDSVMPIIEGLWDTVKKAMPGIQAIFELVFPLIVVAVKLVIDIVAMVIEVVKGIYDFIKPGLDDVAELFSAIFGGIKTVIEGVQDALDWFNGTEIEDKNATVNTEYTTSGSTSQFGGIDTGSPYGGARPPVANARGTNNFQGGLTWVGEEGPELMSLQKGTKIYDNKKSMDMAKRNDKGFNLIIETFVNERKQDVEELAEELSYYIKKKELGGA
jgi:TP901 family phage tail tape measure protein